VSGCVSRGPSALLCPGGYKTVLPVGMYIPNNVFLMSLYNILIYIFLFMYALFVLPVHVYYVNCNAKTQMGYLCALIE